jgi:hypothetical protein
MLPCQKDNRSFFEKLQKAAPEVILLSCFRDDVLLQTKLGKLFVAFYYRLSPPLASLIEKTSFLRAATRTLFLAPILRLVKFLKSSE